MLLDTHALIWWVDGDNQRLSPRALGVCGKTVRNAAFLPLAI
jgi:PIN domain nuclease of toxin-antitoxin system